MRTMFKASRFWKMCGEIAAVCPPWPWPWLVVVASKMPRTICDVSKSSMPASRLIAGAVVREPTTRRCRLVWSFHGLDPMVDAIFPISLSPGHAHA